MEYSILSVNNSNITVIKHGIIKINPPIVGVPALALWAYTYTLILCPAFTFFKMGIKIIPNIVDMINPIINANNDFVNISILSHPIYLNYIIKVIKNSFIGRILYTILSILFFISLFIFIVTSFIHFLTLILL